MAACRENEEAKDARLTLKTGCFFVGGAVLYYTRVYPLGCGNLPVILVTEGRPSIFFIVPVARGVP